MKVRLVIISYLISVSFVLFAQDNNRIPAFVKDSLDQYILRAMSDWQIPGMAVGIVKDGKIITLKGFGYLSQERKVPVNEQSLFMIGSNTKAFTATALALLDDEQKCSLNDKVIKWLPQFKMKDPWINKEINLIDLLCHRIGLESYQGDFIYWASDLTAKQVMEKFGKLSPSYGFRSKYGYTNAAFLIAGECINKISGIPWNVFLKNRIYDPLQMNRTQALSMDFPKQTNISAAHTMRNDSLIEIPIGNIDNLNAAGSMGSSVSDMCHWLLCQLDSGRYEGKQVIPFRAIERTRTPQSIVGISKRPFNRSHFALYGLGWRLSDYEGKEIIAHAGAVDGFHSSVSLLPEIGLGIVILTNTDSNDFYEALKWDIIDAYLNLPSRNYNLVYLKAALLAKSKELAEIESWRDSVNQKPAPSLKLQKYTGTYHNEVYGYIQIAIDEEKLILRFEHHPNLQGKLECLGGNRFLCTYSNPEFGIKVVNFEIAKKKAVAIIIRVSEDIDNTAYEFRKK